MLYNILYDLFLCRMVNAANLSRLGQPGKPVLISKGLPGTVTTSLVRAAPGTKITNTNATSAGTSATTTSLVIGGQTVKVPSSINLNSALRQGGTTTTTTTQHVMIGNQLVKIQSSSAATGDNRGKPVILSTNTGQTYKVQMQGSQGKLIKVGVVCGG